MTSELIICEKNTTHFGMQRDGSVHVALCLQAAVITRAKAIARRLYARTRRASAAITNQVQPNCLCQLSRRRVVAAGSRRGCRRAGGALRYRGVRGGQARKIRMRTRTANKEACRTTVTSRYSVYVLLFPV